MAGALQVQAEIVGILGEADIESTYTAVGSPFTAPIRIMALGNSCNTDMLWSMDGTNDHFFTPAGTARVYDFCANRKFQDEQFCVATGTQMYVKYVLMPDSGSAYVEGIYGV